MADLCYLCGKPATKPLELKDSFTSHSQCRIPTSDKMCDRCHSTIAGDQKQLWYWNEGKNKWSKLWGRSLSRIYLGDKLIAPVIEGTREGLPVVKNLLTRVELRGYLLNPPQPPFTIAIAESGQKHILPWAQEALNRVIFPVQFELDCVYVVHNQFTVLLGFYEQLMALGFSKTEIDSGNYRSDRLMQNLEKWERLEGAIAPLRGTRLLQLISFVGSVSGELSVNRQQIEMHGFP